MTNYFKKAISNLEIFFKGEIKTHEDIFHALKTIFSIDSGCIYFITPENLRVEYSYPTNNTYKNITINQSQQDKIFDTKNNPTIKIYDNEKSTLVERLYVHSIVYGIILIERDKEFTDDEKTFFKTCAMVISSILKDIELTKVMKMQTEALQEGIIETTNANKIIKSQNKKIIASDKIKTKFLSHVSHELRTPLNSIIGFSELLQNPRLGTLNDKQQEFVKDIQTASIGLLGMINEILDISKIESGTIQLNLREFDISMCIQETLNILKPLYEKKGLQINLSTENIHIVADYQKIQQILFNIINNAIKFSPNNETIKIFTQKSKKYLAIHIKDNGCGIEQKNQKKIFKKFEQINSTENSTGLGLTISKELLKMHNGKIILNSQPDNGAEFIIKLPIQ